MSDYDNLVQQLTNQRKNLNTNKYYKGSIDSMGGIDTATQYMASLLTRSGIRDLSEIKEVTETKPVYGFPSDIPFRREEDGSPKIVRPEEGGQFYEVIIGPNPEGGDYTQLVPVESIPQVQTGSNTYTKLINSRTGEQLKQGHDASYIYANTQNSYVDGKPDSEYTIGGSFAGGNTSLKLRMVDGVPMFYSTPGPSSSDFPKEAVAFGLMMASFAVPGLGAAVGGSITGALGITASAAVNAAIGTGVLTTLASGGDVKKGVISGLTSFIAPAIAAEIGNAAGNIFDSPVGAKMFANMSAAALRTAALGGNSDDIGKAVLGTATGEMFNVVASQIPGFTDIKDPATKAAISSSIQAALSTPGDLSEKAQAAMLQGSITMGLSELEIDGKKFNQLPPAQQSIARQALTSALTGKPLNERAILNTALSAASKEVQAAIKAEQAPSAESKTEPQPDLAAFDASVGLTKPAAPLEKDVGLAVSPSLNVPGAAPSDEVLTAEAPSGIVSPATYQTPFAEYASAATSDVPAQDISISNLPESMRPREGEIVTDATYGPEGEVRVTMVGKRPDGTEYSYTAVQDSEDKSVFYETASGGEAGGTTSISDTRPAVKEKPADNIVITGEDGATVTLNPEGSLVEVADADGNKPSNVQEVVANVISNPVNVDTLKGAGGADITGGEAGEDTAQGAGSDAATGETKTSNKMDDLEETADYTDAINNALAGLDYATEEDVENIINLTLKANPNLTEKQVSNIVGGHLDQLDIPTDVDIQSIVNESIKTADLASKTAVTEAIAGAEQKTAAQLGELKTDLLDRIKTFENAGLTRDQATQASLSELAEELGDTEENLLAKLGTTESSLKSELETGLAGVTTKFGEELGGLKTDLVSRVQAFENAGLTRDQALQASISELAEELGDTEEGLLAKLGTTETQLKSEIGGVETRLGEQISDVQSQITTKLSTAVDSITQKVNEFESMGATRDEALSAALDNVASDLGLAREEFLEQLGETETTLGERIAKSETAFAEQIGGLQTDLIAKIGALEEAGLSRDDAIKQSIASLAGELGETETGLLQKIGTTESNIKTQLEGVTTEFGEKLGDIQEQIAGQGLEYATKLSTAVGDINERMTQFESIGATRDEALQAAIDNVADNLGVTSESLLEQLNLNKTELQDQIEQANLDYAKQVAGLGTDITSVKTGLETLGTKVGEQVGGLGTKVAGIEQTLAKQPEQWAKLFSNLQTGFGTQISGLQSQLARQNAEQRAAQQAAQQAAMAPKFETFYANIQGYKPFDLRQFSSDFYDEE